MFHLYDRYKAKGSHDKDLPNDSPSNVYQQMIDERIAKREKKAKFWYSKEHKSLGIYEYDPIKDVYQRISIYDRLKNELALLEKCKSLIKTIELDESSPNYKKIKNQMKECFTKEEYHHKTLTSLRKGFKSIEHDNGCTILSRCR